MEELSAYSRCASVSRFNSCVPHISNEKRMSKLYSYYYEDEMDFESDQPHPEEDNPDNYCYIVPEQGNAWTSTNWQTNRTPIGTENSS